MVVLLFLIVFPLDFVKYQDKKTRVARWLDTATVRRSNKTLAINKIYFLNWFFNIVFLFYINIILIMKKIKISTIIFLSFLTHSAFSQTIEGYKFERFPVKVLNVKKAELNYSSHKLGKEYRIEFTKQYKIGKVDFGGHFIIIRWGAGSGLTLGAIVDVNDGKIYEIPLNEENSYRGTYHDNNNNILYKQSSNLFICYSSKTNEKDENNVDLKYYFYQFDEVTKKFSLLKTKDKTVKRID